MLAEVVTQGQSIGELMDSMIRNDAFWLFVISSVLIPFVNAAITHVAAHDGVKAMVTAVLAGLTALVAWITDVGGVVDNWRAALGVFIMACLGAGGINAAIVRGKVRNDIATAIPLKLGKPKYFPQPEADAA